MKKTVDRFWESCKREVQQRKQANARKQRLARQQRKEEVAEIVFRKSHHMPV